MNNSFIQILNPDGVVISVPYWAMQTLRRMRLLEYNREARRQQVSAAYFSMLDVIKGVRVGFINTQNCHRQRLYEVLGPRCDGVNTKIDKYPNEEEAGRVAGMAAIS